MPWGMDVGVDTRPAQNDSILAFVTPKGGLAAVRRSDGSTKWLAPGSWRGSENVLIAGGSVVVTLDTVHAFDLQTGEKRWSYWAGESARFGTATTAGNTIYITTRDWRLVALDANSGDALWERSLRDSLAGLPRLVSATVGGDTVYATVQQKYSEANGLTVLMIFAIDRSDGRVLFKMQEGTYTDFIGYVQRPTIAGRLLIMPHTLSNRLTAYDRFTGRVAWRMFSEAGWGGFLGKPALAGGVIYASSGDRRVYAVNATSGAVLWKSAILNGSQDEATVCGPFVFSWAGLRTIVLNRATGKQVGVLDAGLDASRSYSVAPLTDGTDAFVMSVREVRRFTC